MGTTGTRAITQSGDFCVAFNDHCLTYNDNSGSFSATVTLIRGGNPIAGPTVVAVDPRVGPLLSDFDSGFVPGTICLGWSVLPGDQVQWIASGTVDRGGGTTDPNGFVPAPNNTYSKYLCVGVYPDPIFDLVGSVGGWPQGNHFPTCGGNPTPALSRAWGSLKILYR